MRTGNFEMRARRRGFLLVGCFMNISLNDRHEPVKWRTRNSCQTSEGPLDLRLATLQTRRMSKSAGGFWDRLQAQSRKEEEERARTYRLTPEWQAMNARMQSAKAKAANVRANPSPEAISKSRLAWRAVSRGNAAEMCSIKPSSKPFCVFGSGNESALPEFSLGGEVAIYALVDPRDETVRYVGKSVDPTLRLAYHVEDRRGRKGAWIAELKDDGLVPRMEILDRANWSEWEIAEQRWIQFYAGRGSLYNVEVGGRGYLHKALYKRSRGHRRKRRV